MQKIPVIIDTDIGSDVDDAIALVYALKSDALDIKGITTVHGNTKIRAQIAKCICDHVIPGNTIPVVPGCAKSERGKETFWIGFEGNGYKLSDSLYTQPVEDFIYETAKANNKIAIIAIGPYTNLSKTIVKYSDFHNFIDRVYLMNRVGESEFDPEAHNTKADPYAADTLIRAGIPITLIPTSLAKKTYFTAEDFQAMKTDVGKMIAQNAKDWMAYSRYDVCYQYDPLTVAVAESGLCREGKFTVVEKIPDGFEKTLRKRCIN